MRFDRFTERAQDAAARAYEIVQRYSHTQVDTEHLFLALLEQADGVVPQILDQLSIDSSAMEARLDEHLRNSPKVAVYGGGVGQIFYTPRIRTVLELAQGEANRLKDEFISTEHIFLAMLSERNTPTSRILQEFGITRERVMEAIRDIRGGQRVTDRQESCYLTHTNAATHELIRDHIHRQFRRIGERAKTHIALGRRRGHKSAGRDRRREGRVHRRVPTAIGRHIDKAQVGFRFPMPAAVLNGA